MNTQNAATPPSQPMQRILGFEVAGESFQLQTAAGVGRGPSSARMGSSRSLLSLELSSSPVSSCNSDSENEERESDTYEDDEEHHPNAVAIIQKDDDYYKLMLRARAVVNARLWSGQAAQHPAH